MGLDTTHGCWHGSYNGFQHWRREVARAAGYPVNEAPDVLAGESYYGLPEGQFDDANYLGEWADPSRGDPLLFLLVHSDCDGVIHPGQASALAGRLEQMLPLLTGRTREATERFAAGLREAAAAGEDVEFR